MDRTVCFQPASSELGTRLTFRYTTNDVIIYAFDHSRLRQISENSGRRVFCENEGRTVYISR
jgi:hypothetical protein